MKRLVGLATAAAIMTLAAVAGAEDTPSIKEIMGKLHKGANAPLGKLKGALKAESPDWKEVQSLSKDFVILGAGLAKNEPPRGDKAAYEKLANSYYENAKDLDNAAKAEDKDKSQAALNKIGASCKACHTAHKGN
ncbi:MAG: cytochrome c [Isosphaeraceae bacterium]|nr:cytochrome c [Isosphaeraceae bacterium]